MADADEKGLVHNVLVALLVLIGTGLIGIDGFLANQVWNNNESITELKSAASARKEINEATNKARDAKLDQLDSRQIINTSLISGLKAEIAEIEKNITRTTDVDISGLRSEMDNIRQKIDLIQGKMDSASASDGQRKRWGQGPG